MPFDDEFYDDDESENYWMLDDDYDEDEDDYDEDDSWDDDEYWDAVYDEDEH